MGVLISLFVVIIAQYTCISIHQIVHLKYIQFLFVNYTSVKLGERGGLSKRSQK